GENEFDLAALAALERIARADPGAVHGFRAIVRAILAFGRAGDEEARAEAPRPSRGRDPVAVVGDVLRVDVEVFRFEQFAERQLALVQGRAEMLQLRGALRVDRGILCIEGEKNPRFLETFARRGN